MWLGIWICATAVTYVLSVLYGPALDLVTRLLFVVPFASALTFVGVFTLQGRTLNLSKKQAVSEGSRSKKLAASATTGAMPQQVEVAAREGNVDRIRAVMDAGINVNATDAKGQSMLHIASELGHAESIRLLLNHSDNRADIHARDAEGCTALHLAAGAGQGVAVKILLERGAQLDAKDLKGLQPLDHAQQTGHRGCELLMKRALSRPLSGAHVEKLTQRNIAASPA